MKTGWRQIDKAGTVGVDNGDAGVCVIVELERESLPVGRPIWRRSPSVHIRNLKQISAIEIDGIDLRARIRFGGKGDFAVDARLGGAGWQGSDQPGQRGYNRKVHNSERVGFHFVLLRKEDLSKHSVLGSKSPVTAKSRLRSHTRSRRATPGQVRCWCEVDSCSILPIFLGRSWPTRPRLSTNFAMSSMQKGSPTGHI